MITLTFRHLPATRGHRRPVRRAYAAPKHSLKRTDHCAVTRETTCPVDRFYPTTAEPFAYMWRNALPTLRSALAAATSGKDTSALPFAVNFSPGFDTLRTPHAVTAAKVRQVFVARGTCHATDRQAVYSRLPCAVEGNRPFRPRVSHGDTRTNFRCSDAERRQQPDLQAFASRPQPCGTAAPVACACHRSSQHPRQ